MTEKIIGIMSALHNEAQELINAVKGPTKIIGNTAYHQGEIDGQPVVVTEAGVGKVNAAIGATVLFGYFDCHAVVFSGTAGGIDPAMKIGDVVVGSEILCYDYGAQTRQGFVVYEPGSMPLRDPCGELFFSVDGRLLAKLQSAIKKIDLPQVIDGLTSRVIFGKIVTGDTFLSCTTTKDRLYAEFACQAADMSAAALAQVAQHFKRNHLTVRCISDLAGTQSDIDHRAFAEKASAVSAVVVRCALKQLA